jgi:hypothetical protein
MVEVLETDLKSADIDEALTDIVSGAYEHINRNFKYKYKS